MKEKLVSVLRQMQMLEPDEIKYKATAELLELMTETEILEYMNRRGVTISELYDTVHKYTDRYDAMEQRFADTYGPLMAMFASVLLCTSVISVIEEMPDLPEEDGMKLREAMLVLDRYGEMMLNTHIAKKMIEGVKICGFQPPKHGLS